MLKELIGAQIVDMTASKITIKKDDKIIDILIDDDEGDCCGFNSIQTELLFSPNDNRNPIITNIESEDEDAGDGEKVIITFFGEFAPIAKLESLSSSGSGWGYGATVSLQCKELGINEVITSW